MISQFNMGNIRILKELGYEVHVACNFIEGNTCDQNSIIQLKKRLEEEKVSFYQIDFSRSISRLRQNLRAYNQVKRLMKKNRYCFIHCHSPIGGVVGRLAGWRTKTKVIYTAHGFHFYKGAPLQNWLLYYPIEVICSGMTDVLITINKEDYQRAKKRMHAGKIQYIPGIGINIAQFGSGEGTDIRDKKREELGVTEKRKLLLSVGELNENKNHEVVIKALSEISDADYGYFICGEGKLKNYLQELIVKYSLQDRIKLLGYRPDVRELYLAADLFVLPSKREGLSVALMEAMASGLPVVCTGIRGNVDLVVHKKEGLLVGNPASSDAFKAAVQPLIHSAKMREQMGEAGKRRIEKFSIQEVEKKMRLLYQSI